MKYTITIVDLEPDGNEPSIHLTALIEDLSKISEIANVKIQNERISFESNLSETVLKDAFKPSFSSVFDHIRFVNLGTA